MSERHVEITAALRALPLERPPVDAWPAIAARLHASRRDTRRPLMLAAAALLLLALIVPAWLQHDPPAVPADRLAGASLAEQPTLDELMQESAQLEQVVAALLMPDAANGAALLLDTELVERIQQIDAQLGADEPAADLRFPLWQERVVLLRELAGQRSARQLALFDDAAGASSRMVF